MASTSTESNAPRHDDTGSANDTDDTSSAQRPSGGTGACHPCRSRKVKCDGQEICSRCVKYDIQCVYDSVPNRRGPDRVARRRRRSKLQVQADQQKEAAKAASSSTPQASSSRAPAPQRSGQHFTTIPSDPDDDEDEEPSTAIRRTRHRNASGQPLVSTRSQSQRHSQSVSSNAPSDTDHLAFDRGREPRGSSIIVISSPSGSPRGRLPDTPEGMHDYPQNIATNPSLQFYRKTWWEMVMEAYSPNPGEAVRLISKDLITIFKNAHHALNFIHVPDFLNRVSRPQTRERMQPSLILSVLALSAVMQSTNNNQSRMKFAMLLHSWSHAAFEASINAQWIDVQLAQAAMLISVFEATPHTLQSYERLHAAWNRIDVVVYALGLHNIDADHPGVSVIERGESGTFVESLRHISLPSDSDSTASPPRPSTSVSHRDPQAQPLRPQAYRAASEQSASSQYGVSIRSGSTGSHSPESASTHHDGGASGCTCAQSTLLATARTEARSRLSPGLLYSPGWDQQWSEEEVAREEARRAFWMTYGLVANGQTHTTAHSGTRPQFRLASIPNISVFLPGEYMSISRGSSTSAAKSTVWALNGRAYALWGAAVQLDDATSSGLLSPERKAPIASQIWLETERLSNALNRHQCGVEASQLHAARYFLQFSRMIATNDYTHHVPSAHAGRLLPQQREAATWIAHLKLFIDRAQAPQAIDDMMRSVAWNPWMVWYLVDHTARCMSLWEVDHSLTVALEVADQMQPALWAIINQFRPAPFLEQFGTDLTSRLQKARQIAGLASQSRMVPTKKLEVPWPSSEGN